MPQPTEGVADRYKFEFEKVDAETKDLTTAVREGGQGGGRLGGKGGLGGDGGGGRGDFVGALGGSSGTVGWSVH